ncbi:UNKNOWN [Stylonychia lemnae]|uniref:Uncharacterized protein n=1 Tax=Stylonychia lemnae TaxID=5949 RepID=A0A078AY46_STYLE|nr:UNKNOWN [Stylonychia lemnae]|eukprot:CDW87089.1 UNKNOWN [Stylonychia lemnae]
MLIDNTSQNTRATLGSVNTDEPFVFEPPKHIHYQPLRIGTVGRKTKLEEILDNIKLSFEQYIWYTDVSKVESLRPMDSKQFCFKLKFYKKDGNFKIPQKEFDFTCKDSEAFFTVQHVIQRQMPLNWQQFFEKNIDIQANDCYQFHAYLLKTNRFGSAQPRFIMLTSFWMINAKASFDKTNGEVKFEKMKWKIPIEAVIRVQIKESQQKYNVKIYSEFERQNKVLVENNLKKIKKTERDFTFNDITTCRDFIFHLKRIYHLHNCCGVDNKTPPLLVEIK